MLALNSKKKCSGIVGVL